MEFKSVQHKKTPDLDKLIIVCEPNDLIRSSPKIEKLSAHKLATTSTIFRIGAVCSSKRKAMKTDQVQTSVS